VGLGLVVLIAAGGALYFRTKKSRGPDVTSAVSATTSASSVVSATPVPATIDNRWIVVPPPPTPIVLGLASDGTPAAVRGLRPARKVMSPSTTYSMQEHEVTWSEMDHWLVDNASMTFPVDGHVPKEAAARAKLPATGVPWEVASAYCHSLGGALPAEEQWEYAARGPEKRTYAWGKDPIDLVRTHAFAGSATPVAVMTSDQDVTPSGLHDLMGNAREWTASPWREDVPGANESWVQDGVTSARAVRGWPLAGNAPAGFAGMFAEYRDWVCATGGCSPLHAELDVKLPLLSLSIGVIPATDGATSPLRTWASGATFTSLASSCLRGAPLLPAETSWLLHGDGKYGPGCPPGYEYRAPDQGCAPGLNCWGPNDCIELRQVVKTTIGGDALPAPLLQCLRNGIGSFAVTTGQPWSDDVTVKIVTKKVPDALAEIGFRCVRAEGESTIKGTSSVDVKPSSGASAPTPKTTDALVKPPAKTDDDPPEFK
jgi:formylglycine-generating enzyme required for sulfatase activity